MRKLKVLWASFVVVGRVFGAGWVWGAQPPHAPLVFKGVPVQGVGQKSVGPNPRFLAVDRSESVLDRKSVRNNGVSGGSREDPP